MIANKSDDFLDRPRGSGGFFCVAPQPMQEGVIASSLGHRFHHPESQIFGQALGFERGVHLFRGNLTVFQ
jgi:hypothetical protein